MQIVSQKRTFRFSAPQQVMLSLPGWTNSQGTPTPKLYFYVPEDTDRLAIYTNYVSAGPPRFFDPTGNEVQPELIDNGHLLIVPLAVQHRGKVWSLDRAKCPIGPLVMLNVPASFAFSPASLLVPEDALPQAATQQLDHQLLFDSGRDGYGRYRIPSLVVTPSATVLAICEGRKDGGGLTGNIDLVLRRSRDGGKSWSPLEVVADDGANTLGNPCVLVDQSTKTVWLAFTRSLGTDTEEQIVAGTSRERTRVLLTKSTNDGEDWTEPIDISAMARQPGWTWYGTGPGAGIQLKSGRLVIPAYHAEEQTGVYRSHMVYSDDHGRTWKCGDPVGEHCGECHVVERLNGDLVLNARSNQGPQRRVTAVSRDGGASWTKATYDAALYDPHCQACAIRIPSAAGEVSRWLFSHPAGPGRRDLTVRLSHDEGQSWPVAKRLRTGDSQYSSLASLPDGSLGCLYDCWIDGNYRLLFVRFSESWLARAEE
jgi:sialidase-1